MTTLALIAAVARNRAIGKDNKLLWNLPEDMRHFREATGGATVIMGRKTWESLPPRFRPLPGRRNIIVSRQPFYPAEGAEIAPSLPAALSLASSEQNVFVIGGAALYAQALPLAQQMILTEVDLAPEADAFFPEFSSREWRETQRQPGQSANGLAFAFVTYQRDPTQSPAK